MSVPPWSRLSLILSLTMKGEWVIQVSTPNECRECQAVFDADRLLRDEMRYIALTQGPGAATAVLNDRLAEEHIEHEQNELKRLMGDNDE